MKRVVITTVVLSFLLVSRSQPAAAHCEVPCGIYADEQRFLAMLEDQTTIAKAIDQMNAIAADMDQGPDPQSINQIVRWTNTKETHATNTQHIIAQYFMTQRIKPDADGYVKKLTSAHVVMQAAMKCKQTADPANAKALRKAILDFYRAYEGKEPQLEK